MTTTGTTIGTAGRPAAAGPAALLGGSLLQPRLLLIFDYHALHPDGGALREWVKTLPDRRWDKKLGGWMVAGIGPDPAAVLTDAGFRLDTHTLGTDLAETPLQALTAPAIAADPRNRDQAIVYPRLYGTTDTLAILGAGTVPNHRQHTIGCDLTAANRLADLPGVIVDPDLTARLTTHIDTGTGTGADHPAAVRQTALTAGHADPDAADTVAATVGDIPDWFGINLYGYQRGGALAAAAGRHLIADPPGVGKTGTALAATAIAGCRRILAVVPPIMLTQWGREADRAHVATSPDLPDQEKTMGRHPAGSPAADSAQVATIRPGRKPPTLPDRGLVIVADSLVTSRTRLFDQLAGWRPDGLIYDEAHRARGQNTARSQTMRALASRIADGGLRLALTGTPILSGSPADLLPVLHITGQAATIGGSHRFLTDYCREDRWGRMRARPGTQEQLRHLLDGRIWIRRAKTDVLPDLPAKHWDRQHLDVDLTDYRAAHQQVIDTIADWITDFTSQNGREPDDNEARQWCRGHVGLISPLRRAAGLAKTDPAADWATGRLADTGRPVIIWAHHTDVIAALAGRLDNTAVDGRSRPVDTAVIDGSTSHTRRAHTVDQFQTGQIDVLICQITAAGVGITLTAANEALFAETDWIAPLVTQAEDRTSRVGATMPCLYTTLLAEGTLDDRIEAVRATKAADAAPIVGTTGGTAAAETLDGGMSVDEDGTPPWEVAYQLFDQARQQHRGQ